MTAMVTISIEVPDTTYQDAWNLVDGALAGLDMKRDLRFRFIGAMQKLAEAVTIAEQKETVAPEGADDG